jgi:hypothetical protein
VVILVAAAIGLGVLALPWFSDPGSTALQDFVEYWAAGRANARGDNPYDPATLYALEKEVNPALTNAIMMWNPPWTLSLVMLFGLLPVWPGYFLWLLLQLAMMLLAADWLWRYYGGPVRFRWLAWLVCLGFVPCFLVLRLAQISPLVLVGVIGFLAFMKRGRPGWAGAMLLLALIKPHIVSLFVVAVGLWSLRERRWSIFTGGALAVVALTAAPLACNPHVWHQYQEAVATRPPEMLSPTIGSLLRLAFGLDKLWLQFLPLKFGLVWVVVHWYRHRDSWYWGEQAPWLLMASFLTASYGAWPFDLVVLLVPVIQVAVGVFRARTAAVTAFALIALLGFDILAVLLLNVRWSEQHWHVWMTPMLLYCYVSLRRQTAKEPSASLALAGA